MHCRLFFVFLIAVLFQRCLVPSVDSAYQPTVLRVIKPKYAKGFEFHQLSDSSTRIIFLNLEKSGDTLQKIIWKNTPVTKMACFSTTHISFIQHLGRLDDMKATGFADLVMNPEVKQHVASGQIINLTKGHDLDDEVVYNVMPQLMFVYPFGGASYEKYLQNGIGCIQISEYLEETPLGRAEWIKVFGVLLGEEEKADRIFGEVEDKYNALCQLVQTSGTNTPTVFTGSYDSGNWFMPPGNSFAARMMADAGAKYIYADSISTGNLVIPFESLFHAAYQTDFWGKVIHEPAPFALDKLVEGDERMKQFKSFQEKKIFYCNTAFADYHGEAVMEPQVLLADLIAIFHPELMPQHTSVYFQIWKEESER